jgi:prepilin-type processing-associated H-X9-DG protein/prepilin-type N-terminal cleavage/methylation domain-containing protein
MKNNLCAHSLPRYAGGGLGRGFSRNAEWRMLNAELKTTLLIHHSAFIIQHYSTPTPALPRSSGRGSKSAFSLIELLVVIGIIALLLSILLPTVSKARQEAARIQCLSNLRQMAAAAQHYAIANKTYPASHYSVTIASGTYNYDWDWCYAPGAAPTPGLLWLGEHQVPVDKCPAWDGRQFTNPGALYCGYNYNVSFVGGEPQFGDPNTSSAAIKCIPARLGTISHPSEAALFGDAQNSAFWCNTYMRSPLPSPSEQHWFGPQTASGMTWAAYNDGGAARNAGAQGFRHRGGTNMSFCDGHAETIKAFVAAPHMPAGVGFISIDNSMYGG